MLIQSYVITATVPEDNQRLLDRLANATIDADLVNMTIGAPDDANKVLVTITFKGDKTPAADVRMAALGCVKMLGLPNGADAITCHIEYERASREQHRAMMSGNRRIGGGRPERPTRPTKVEAE